LLFSVFVFVSLIVKSGRYGIKAEAGAMELCGKILDACASQQVDFQVHCGAALVLLAPLVAPWRVRERVWRHFGELRVLHLLEDAALLEGLLPLLDAAPDGPGAAPAATAPARGSASALVGTAIAAALSGLRSLDDRRWLVCSLGLYHLAAGLFASAAPAAGGGVTLALPVGPAVRQLKELVADPGVEDWVVAGVLQAAAWFASTVPRPWGHEGVLAFHTHRISNVSARPGSVVFVTFEGGSVEALLAEHRPLFYN